MATFITRCYVFLFFGLLPRLAFAKWNPSVNRTEETVARAKATGTNASEAVQQAASSNAWGLMPWLALGLWLLQHAAELATAAPTDPHAHEGLGGRIGRAGFKGTNLLLIIGGLGLAFAAWISPDWIGSRIGPWWWWVLEVVADIALAGLLRGPLASTTGAARWIPIAAIWGGLIATWYVAT